MFLMFIFFEHIPQLAIWSFSFSWARFPLVAILSSLSYQYDLSRAVSVSQSTADRRPFANRSAPSPRRRARRRPQRSPTTTTRATPSRRRAMRTKGRRQSGRGACAAGAFLRLIAATDNVDKRAKHSQSASFALTLCFTSALFEHVCVRCRFRSCPSRVFESRKCFCITTEWPFCVFF